MVQRKVINKVGIQADHVKSEKLLINLKPSSFHHHEGKNMGAETKKMKKSRSIKRSDFECLRSPKQVPQPGKPPPLVSPTTAASQQKQPPAKPSNASPNYMKSTSSSDARKERSQVSFQTGSDGKNHSRKNTNNSKHSPASVHKPARTLTRTSSLKLVRTLTKTPSFKPARSSAKKCSPVILCENLDVQRSTCSSTMKDSKFPPYLTLNPGGTESEGTSAEKVCPYTYCSLNGHHHTPLPPLKCFLSAKRRMLKTQKSIKLACLSPRRARPSGDGMKEIDTWQVIFDEKPASQEIQEEHTDFFIEIYSKEREDDADTTRSEDHGDDHGQTDVSVTDTMASAGGKAERAAEADEEQVEESLSDEPQCSGVDFEENHDQNNGVVSTDMDIAEFSTEEDQNVVAEELYSPSFAQEETMEVESPSIIQQDEPDSEASDMEWEAAQYSAPCLDDELDQSVKPNNKSDNYSFPEIVSSNFKEIPGDEACQESFDEISVSTETWSVNSDSESDSSYQNSESNESIEDSDNQVHDHSTPIYDEFKESTITERRDGDDCMDTAITLIPVEEPTQETTASEDENQILEANGETPSMYLQLGNGKTDSVISIKDEALIDDKDNEYVQIDDTNVLPGNHEYDNSYDFTKEDLNETCKDYIGSHNIEVHQSGVSSGSNEFSDEVSDENLLSGAKDSVTDQNSFKQESKTGDAGDGMEKQQVDAGNSLNGFQTFALLQGSPEADHETSSEDHDESQLGGVAKEGKSNQTSADECLAAETQDHSSPKEPQGKNVVNDQNYSDKYQDEAVNLNTSNSMDSADQTQSEINGHSLAAMDVEHTTKSEAEDTCPSGPEETSSKVEDTSSKETNRALPRTEGDSTQELFNTCQKLIGKIRCKRPVEELEEPREFNPRGPNFLPVQPDPEAEKVDLRHQMMDEKKNAEEWMLDFALRQAVTKLAPARKRKVALMVEAFETVMPIPKYETHPRHTPAAFAHARPMQACS